MPRSVQFNSNQPAFNEGRTRWVYEITWQVSYDLKFLSFTTQNVILICVLCWLTKANLKSLSLHAWLPSLLQAPWTKNCKDLFPYETFYPNPQSPMKLIDGTSITVYADGDQSISFTISAVNSAGLKSDAVVIEHTTPLLGMCNILQSDTIIKCATWIKFINTF